MLAEAQTSAEQRPRPNSNGAHDLDEKQRGEARWRGSRTHRRASGQPPQRHRRSHGSAGRLKVTGAQQQASTKSAEVGRDFGDGRARLVTIGDEGSA